MATDVVQRVRHARDEARPEPSSTSEWGAPRMRLPTRRGRRRAGRASWVIGARILTRSESPRIPRGVAGSRRERREPARAEAFRAPRRGSVRCATTGMGRDRPRAAPSTTISPPASPPSGPRSTIQSAVFTTSRLCSITSTVLPGGDESLQHGQQLADVLEVQPGRRLVEDVERVPGGALLQLGRQLDPLGLAARERGRRLPELHVPEPDVGQGLQVPLDRPGCSGRTRAPRPRSSRARRRSSGACTAPRGSRGCTGVPCTPRTSRTRRGGSASRS